MPRLCTECYEPVINEHETRCPNCADGFPPEWYSVEDEEPEPPDDEEDRVKS